jgi:hypothetical protein
MFSFNSILEAFPDSHIHSEEDSTYNCVAFAISPYIQDTWWWPQNHPDAFWPQEDAGEELSSFLIVFEALGYEEIDINNVELEEGFEKIAIYQDGHGLPSHVARQIVEDTNGNKGKWASKCGTSHDIIHSSLTSLEDDVNQGIERYGTVTRILRRIVEAPTSSEAEIIERIIHYLNGISQF